MYQFVKGKESKPIKKYCSDIINQLVQRINNGSVMTVKVILVGSGAGNLITQNGEKGTIDFDFNLCVLKAHKKNYNNCRDIKEYIREQLNIVLNNNGWGDCQDSKSALSTKKRCLPNGNRTSFSIDLAIVRERNNVWGNG